LWLRLYIYCLDIDRYYLPIENGCSGYPRAAVFELSLKFIKRGQERGQLWKRLFANGYRGFVAFRGLRGLDTFVLGHF
jgi:hypothetical protein